MIESRHNSVNHHGISSCGGWIRLTWNHRFKALCLAAMELNITEPNSWGNNDPSDDLLGSAVVASSSRSLFIVRDACSCVELSSLMK